MNEAFTIVIAISLFLLLHVWFLRRWLAEYRRETESLKDGLVLVLRGLEDSKAQLELAREELERRRTKLDLESARRELEVEELRDLVTRSAPKYAPQPALPKPAAQPTLPKPVALGASAPQVIKPGDEFTARFVAYTEDIEDHVEHILLKLSPRSEVHLGVKYCKWQVGTNVKVRLTGEHLTVRADEE